MKALRKDFSAELITKVYNTERSIAKTAAVLSTLGKGHVTRQRCRKWLLGLKLVAKPVKATVAPTGPKVLLVDIETAPITAYVWSLWKQNVGLNQIKEEWNILSYCAKWLGDPRIIYEDARNDPADDEHLVRALWSLLDEADIIIAQNGKRFDVPKIQARFVLLGLPPTSPFKVIDTLLMARQQFNFTSNKLAWLTDKLCTDNKKSEHAKFPGFALWSECLKGNPEAWDEMREYNIPDVTSMEELYLILRPWYVGHPNVAIYNDSDEPACPKCASTNIKQDGWTFTQAGKYERIHCGNCGGWSRGRYTRNSTAVRKAQLSN